MSDKPLLHLPRQQPPWASTPRTECGRAVSDVAAMSTRREVMALVAKHGKQRAAFMVCMTCAQQSDQRANESWISNPAGITRRWLDRDGRFREQGSVADRTLHALSALVEAHRAEFDALVSTEDVPDLAERRAARPTHHQPTRWPRPL